MFVTNELYLNFANDASEVFIATSLFQETKRSCAMKEHAETVFCHNIFTPVLMQRRSNQWKI